jgi:phosphate transport system substrate-binding protein
MELHSVNILHTRRGKAASALAGALFLAASAQVASATTEPPATEPAGTEAMGTEAMGTEAMGTEAAAPAYEIPTGIEGEISISGSSTVEPISGAAATAFAEANPGTAISVEGPGTGDGFARFCAGETDISDASRPIKDEEAQTCADNGIEFIELKVAVDGLSVITSTQNTEVECLSFVDLYALLGPDATGVGNWADASATADEIVGTVTDLGAVNTPYPDLDLTVTAPGEESGTFDSFVEIVITPVGEGLGVEDALPRLDYTASPNDNVIIEGISANPGSLGWVGFAFVEENLDVVRPLPVDGGAGCVEPTAESIASGEYPIARDLYVYVSANKLAENPALEAFVDYYVNAGISTLVGTEEGQVPYVALNADDAAATQAVWADRITGANPSEAAEGTEAAAETTTAG